MKSLLYKVGALALLSLVCTMVWSQEWDESDGEGWARYSSLCIAFPFYSWEYKDNDDWGPVEFESNGYTFDYQAHHVSPTIGFAVLFRCGFGGYKGDYAASYKDSLGARRWSDEKVTYSFEDLKGFLTYFKVGFGKAFELLGDRLSLIPTAGLGFDLYALTKKDDAFDAFDETDGKIDISYTSVDCVWDVFLNLMASFMFTEHFGLTASCEMEVPVFGFGLYKYGDDVGTASGGCLVESFSSVNFMPAVGICLRF